MPSPEMRVFRPLCGTARAKVRSRTSVEALQDRQGFNTPGGVMAKAITPLS